MILYGVCAIQGGNKEYNRQGLRMHVHRHHCMRVLQHLYGNNPM